MSISSLTQCHLPFAPFKELCLWYQYSTPLPPCQIIERLSGAGLSGDVSLVIGKCVSVRSEELRAQLLRDSAKVSPSSLSDFDWKLKVSTTLSQPLQS